MNEAFFFSLISSPISCSLGFPVSYSRTGISPFLCVPHSSSSRSEFLDGYVSLLGGSFIFILDPPRRKPSCRRPPRREPWIHAHCSEKVLRNSWSRENVLSLSLFRTFKGTVSERRARPCYVVLYVCAAAFFAPFPSLTPPSRFSALLKFYGFPLGALLILEQQMRIPFCNCVDAEAEKKSGKSWEQMHQGFL